MKQKNLIKKLFKPKPNSHKGDNGIITIIAGSQQYHGSALLAIKAASRIVDLIYFYSPKNNQALAQKIKAGSCEFINLTKKASLLTSLDKSDAILIGPGLELSIKNKILINKILKNFRNNKIILDAGALRLINKALLNKNIIITPHGQEFKALFGLAGTAENARKMAKKYHCTIVLKGAKDVICNSQKIYYNKGGNAGMTKGGTGDVLAGLICALAAKNDVFTAAFYGSFFNKKAGEALFKKVGYYFHATDLANELPKIINLYNK